MLPSRVAVMGAWACSLGLVGIVLGSLAIEVTNRFDATIPSLTASAIGGGLGWCSGLVLGWVRSRGTPRWGSSLSSSLMVALATGVAFVGVTAMDTVANAEFGPALDEVLPGDPRLRLLLAVVGADTAIVVATSLVLASLSMLGRRPEAIDA